jgi:hypothetical protein
MSTHKSKGREIKEERMIELDEQSGRKLLEWSKIYTLLIPSMYRSPFSTMMMMIRTMKMNESVSRVSSG